MSFYENVSNAPPYLQVIFELVHLEHGEFVCAVDATDEQLTALIGLLSAEIAFRASGESVL